MKKGICRTMASDSGHQPICLVTGESISTEDACANQCNSVSSFGEVHECSNKIEYSFDSSIFFTRAGAPGSTAGTSAMDSIMQSSLFSDQDKVGPGNLEQHVFNSNSVQTDCAETTNELEENLETSLLALEGMNGISNFSDKHIPINLHEQGMYYVNMQDLHSKLVSMGPNQGRPVLVLANNPNKGIVEAKVIFDNSQSMDKLVKIQTKQAKRKNSGNKHKGKVADKCFVCGFDDCGRTFTTMGYLRQHQLSHNGERILECSFEGCGRKFAWPAHLRYHMLTHTGQRNYRCSYEGCGKQFYTSQRLGVHLRSHTGEKPYVCPEEGCDKSFSTAGNLKNHTRVHTGERPYVCHEAGCNRSFAEQSSLKKHQYTHTGKKMYVCELCGKSFSQSGSRNVHMKGHFLSKSMKKGRPSKSTSVAPRSNEVDSSQNVLFIQQNQDDLYQFGNPDLHGSPCESVIFPHAVTKDVVAVTTQPGEGDLDLQNNILGAEEVLGSDDCMSTSLPSHTSGANVVVLSQPQEMSSLTTSYHSPQGVKEEIIYQSDLHLTLDHEEMTGNISLHDLHSDQQVHMTTASSIAETTHAQSIDPIMEMDENESDDNESKLTIMCE